MYVIRLCNETLTIQLDVDTNYAIRSLPISHPWFKYR